MLRNVEYTVVVPPLLCLVVWGFCNCCYLHYEELEPSTQLGEWEPKTVSLGTAGCVLFENKASKYLASCSNTTYAPLALPSQTIHLRIENVWGLRTELPLVRNRSSLEYLQLVDDKLTSVTRDMLEGMPDLKRLNLSRNEISYLDYDVFLHTPLLESVDLSKNHLISLWNVTSSLGYLSRLKELRLSRNYLIEYVDSESFSSLHLVPLQTVELSECQLRRIDEDGFEALKDLRHLGLSGNPLSEQAVLNLTKTLISSGAMKKLKTLKLNDMSDVWFFPLQFLRALNLSSVEILELRRSRFLNFPSSYYHLPELKQLDLSFCGVHQIIASQFENMPNLEVLRISNHDITALPKHFLSLMKLEELDLSNVVILRTTDFKSVTVEDFAFEELPNLKVLVICRLLLRGSLQRRVLYGLRRLSKLTMAGNILTGVNDFSFETLRNLKVLDISKNLIENLSNDTFYGLQTLEILSLKDNSITFFNDSYPFEHTVNLRILDLSDNKIVYLPPKIFGKLERLQFLRMNGNFIVSWLYPLFPERHEITFLDISKNGITYFTPAMTDALERIREVNFALNPFNCTDCAMLLLQEWIRNTSTNITAIHLPTIYSCPDTSSLDVQYIVNVTLPAYCFYADVSIAFMLGLSFGSLVCVVALAAVAWYRWQWSLRYCFFHARFTAKKFKEIRTDDGYVFDAFVSYSENDVPWVMNVLVVEMEEREPKLRLCLQDRDFDAGSYVTENVLQAIECSRTVLLVLSNSYMDSEWRQFDLEMAHHKMFDDNRSGLIIMMMDDLEPSKMTSNLRYVLKTRTVIPWTNDPVGQKLFWKRLKLAISSPQEKEFLKRVT